PSATYSNAGWVQINQCPAGQIVGCYQPGAIAVTSNAATIPCGGWFCRSAASPTSIPPNEFMEGAIDLSQLGIDQGCAATFFPVTRSAGSGFTSAIKGFAAPTQFNTCAGSTTQTTPTDASTNAQIPSSGVTLGASAYDMASVTTDTGAKVPTGTMEFFVC